MGPEGQSTGIVRSRNAVDAADRGKVGDVRAQIPVTMSRNCYAFIVFLFNGTPVVVSDCKIRNHLAGSIIVPMRSKELYVAVVSEPSRDSEDEEIPPTGT